MTHHRLLVVSRHADRYLELLEAAHLPDLDIRACGETDAAQCAGVNILFGAPDRVLPLLPHCDSLRWVQSSWAGVKPLIDQPRRDFMLTGVKGIFGQSMTEYVLAWLLALERRVCERRRAQRWDDSADGHIGGKTIGIMGTGSIGSHLARACQALGLAVRGLNTNGRERPHFPHCYAPGNIADFASGLDYLVALLPETPGSDRLIDATVLERLNSGAILVNGGRANVIDMPALLHALRSGALAHAVLDVLEAEPLPEDHPLWQVEGLHLSSHTAAVTLPEAIVEVFCANYRLFHAGLPLKYLVDFGRGY